MFAVRCRPVLQAVLLGFAAMLAALLWAPSASAATRTVIVGDGGDERFRVPVTIQQGDTVIFDFQDGGHDVSMGGPGGESAVINRQDEGFRFTRVLNRPGPYALVCQEHDDDGMNAEFTVEAVPGGPDPRTLPPPARDVVVGSDGDDGRLDPSTVNLFQGAQLLFHFAEADTITFGDGTSSGPQPRGTTYAREMTTLGTLTFSSGSDSGSAIVSENTGSGIRPAPAGAVPAATVQVGSGTSYSPADVTIDEGEVVQWNWAGGTHNVQFDDGTGSEFQSSGSYAAKFFTPSAAPLRFVCTAHPGMEGSVSVNDVGPAGPNEQAPPLDPPPDDGGGDGGGGGITPSAEVTGGAGGNVFAPASVAVQTGQAVRWTWTGVHNVQFTDGIGSSTVPNGTFSRRFFNPGTYDYVCTLHDGMAGTVTATGEPVEDDGTGVSGSIGNDDEPATNTPAGRTATPFSATGSASTPGAAQDLFGRGADNTRPQLRVVRTTLRRNRRAGRIRIAVDEDVLLEVTVRAVGRSRDAVRTRRFRLFAPRGTRNLALPRMTLTARRYRVRVVALDRAGNRSATRTIVVRLSR